MVGAALSSEVVAVNFLGAREGWRGANPETREIKRAKKRIVDLAIIINGRLND